MIGFVSKYTTTDYSRVCEISKEFGIDPVMSEILVDRGMNSSIEINNYINPKLEALYDAHSIPDIDNAAQIIKECIRNKHKICIYGDYDVDGICATAILYKQLKRMGADIICYIPSRLKDGYGMNRDSIFQLKNKGVELIVTVDNGITANEEVALCNTLGIDVVVTDHHIPKEKLPEAKAVVSASRTDSSYPNCFLCGAGVSFKLSTILNDDLIDYESLGLAALATLADIVPLTFENHSIVKIGLNKLRLNKGIEQLLRNLKLSDSPVSSYSASFMISPRLNAAGRMGDADIALKLLLSESDIDIQAILNQLETYNGDRRTAETRIYNDIETYHMIDDTDLAIILYHENWNVGVLGISANKLADKYKKPVILFTNSGDKIVGSGRSGCLIDLYDTISGFSDLFIRFGGHSKALGITMDISNFNDFKSGYLNLLKQELYSECILNPIYEYDASIHVKDINIGLIKDVALFEPFGEGWNEPLFLVTDCCAQDVKIIGKDGTHLSATITDGCSKVRLVGFSKSYYKKTLESCKRINILGRLKENNFGGIAYPEIHLDFALPDTCSFTSPKDEKELLDALLFEFMYNNQVETEMCDIIVKTYLYDHSLPFELTRERLRNNYAQLRKTLSGNKGIIEFNSLNLEYMISALIFVELEYYFISTVEHGFRSSENINKRDLTESSLYNIIIESSFGG